MATIQIGAITIPNAQDASDALSAMAAYFATQAIPTPTNAQILEYLRLKNIDFIKQVTREWRRSQVTVVDPVAS